MDRQYALYRRMYPALREIYHHSNSSSSSAK